MKLEIWNINLCCRHPEFNLYIFINFFAQSIFQQESAFVLLSQRGAGGLIIGQGSTPPLHFLIACVLLVCTIQAMLWGMKLFFSTPFLSIIKIYNNYGHLCQCYITDIMQWSESILLAPSYLYCNIEIDDRD